MNSPTGIKFFGSGVKFFNKNDWIKLWIKREEKPSLLLILAGTCTAEVEGISAAGATSDSRRYTALADAEFLLKGPLNSRRWPLPPLNAGISPALISYVCARWIQLQPTVLAVGLSKKPTFPHHSCEFPSIGPANCLSSGKAMDISRVNALWAHGLSIGRGLTKPLLLAECVPGGTTTAQAVLTGMGLNVADLISGSSRNPPIKIKAALVKTGLTSAHLKKNPLPQELIAAVGDPFQPVAAGILLGARESGQNVLLGGGCQMLAVLALALSALKPSLRAEFVNNVIIGTTAWLLEEVSLTKSKSILVTLMTLIEDFFDVKLVGISSGLRFDKSNFQVLRDYELGYVKEGVGAGALTLLAQLNGASIEDLVNACEKIVKELQWIDV